MKKAVEFLEKELNVGSLLEVMKTINEESYKQFIESFAAYQSLNLNNYIEFNHLNRYKFSLYLLDTSAVVLKMFSTSDHCSQQFQKNVLNILQLLYFYRFTQLEADVFSSYYFAENVLEAVVVTRELNPEIRSNQVFNQFAEFISNQHKMTVDRIQFEKLYIEITDLESFISGLDPRFINHFTDKNFIKPLIDFLYNEDYISKHGVWIEKHKKKSEIFGLVYALKELNIIDRDDANTKKDFHKTFKSTLPDSMIRSQELPTQVSLDAKEMMITGLRDLYAEFIYSHYKNMSL
jgi:hypothetical protein